MTFFVTSKGVPNGANFGGLKGADKHCQAVAATAGGNPEINARDRIGKGPWVNMAGVQVTADVNERHSDKNKFNVEVGRFNNGRGIPGRLFVINHHDILTGSTADGRAYPPGKDMTYGNWTKSGKGSAKVGHHDRMGLHDDAPSKSWNSAHPSRGYSAANLRSSGGAGLLYFFAAN